MMNTCRSSTRSIASRISSRIDAYWARRSTSGTRTSELDANPLPAPGARFGRRLERRDDLGRLAPAGHRLGPRLDALDEMARLRDERLDRRQPRDVQVAVAVDQLELAERVELRERAADVLPVDAGVVEDDLLRRDVVVDHHLLAADDRHPPHLARAEPADVDVRDRRLIVLEDQEADVVDAVLEVVVAVAADGRRRAAEPVVDDRHVVRREVPDRVDVAADPAEVQALRVDVVELAELVALEQAADVLDGRAEAERVPGHQDEAGLASLRAELTALRGRQGERLLDEGVLAGRERLVRELAVRRRLGRDDHGVDVG